MTASWTPCPGRHCRFPCSPRFGPGASASAKSSSLCRYGGSGRSAYGEILAKGSGAEYQGERYPFPDFTSSAITPTASWHDDRRN
ncbi:hypothetical protein GBZ26_09090 [Azospirillum formosense]|uniref:Uncharacterized protein n=1 Tax=Azospirillum formosense TaxID=861533 RepID=A0ABX2L2D7_9PROT|nr:hypothetical protein [Azospirillum formosense]